MKKINIFKVVFAVCAMGTSLLWSLNACADNWNHNQNSNQSSNQNQNHSQNNNQSYNQNGNHGYHHHDHSYVDLGFTYTPDTYYDGPIYYPPSDDVDIPVAPTYEPIIINGTTYYVNNGVYYIYTGYGYQVVQPPTVTTIQTPPVEVAQTPTPPGGVEDDSFTVNIPNAKGAYTAVTLKKSGTGYIGPQGEYYPDFPKVSQLEAMYGK